MKTFRYFYLLTALMTFSACGDDEETQIQVPETDFTHVKIDAMVGRSSLFTRSNPMGETAKQSEFNKGDKLSVNNGRTHVVYTMGDDGWTATGEGLKWEEFPTTFQAYYPAAEGVSFQSFTLPADQASAEKIALADYMTSTRKIDAMPGEGKLILDMARQTARVIVNVSGVDASLGGSLSSMKIYSQYASIPASGTATTIASYVSGHTYAALVVPGEGSDNQVFLELTTANGTKKTVTGIRATTAGKSYAYNIYVGENSIELSEPIVTDWEEGSTLPGDLQEIEKPIAPGYYVKPTATGNASGTDWENAMGANELRDLLKRQSAEELDGKTIYLAGGEYPLVTNELTTGIELGGKMVITLQGGYNPQSEGKSVTDRNIQAYVTSFTNTASLNAITRMFKLGTDLDITFNGITLDGKYNKDQNGHLRGIQVEGCTLNMNNCVIKNFNTGAVDNGDGQGSALRLNAGFIKLNKVEIIDNVGPSRGTINLNCGDNGYSFFNNCLFKGNIIRLYWGVAIQSNGNACINNTTIYNNKSENTTGQCATINGSGNVLFVNSTIYHNKELISKEMGIYRYEGTNNLQFMNSIIVSSNATVPTFKQENGQCTSKGYNVSQNTTGFATNENDNLINGLWSFNYNNGVCEWNAPSDMHFATKSAVTSVVRAYKTDNFPTMGQDFANWLGDDLGKDQNGNIRNPNKMLPGAYDPGL